MSRTVQEGFKELVGRITPEYNDSGSAEKNLHIIENCLKSNFDMAYLATYGSTSHGTNIVDFSDIDCFAVIPKSKLYESVDETLSKLTEVLIEHFPSTTITDGRPTITIPFGTAGGERHQIIPTYDSGVRRGFELYSVPGPSDLWIDVSPGAHSAWIGEIDENLGKNFKAFIRLVKAWNCYNGKPIWSYYLEHCVAEFLSRESSIVYAMDTKNFFNFMVEKNLDPIENAAGSEGLVYGTSIATKDIARKKLADAAELAAEAHKCELDGNVADAYYSWRKVFNRQFPAN